MGHRTLHAGAGGVATQLEDALPRGGALDLVAMVQCSKKFKPLTIECFSIVELL